MQHMQTTDPFLNQQQVRVFTLCCAAAEHVLTDGTVERNSFNDDNSQFQDLAEISVDILLTSIDRELSVHCVALLNNFRYSYADLVCKKPVAHKVTTILYASLRDAEESCMDAADCRHCARVIEWQLALITFLREKLRSSDDRLVYQVLDICFEFSGSRCRSDRVRFRLMNLVRALIRISYHSTTSQYVMDSGVLNATNLLPLVTNTVSPFLIATMFDLVKDIYDSRTRSDHKRLLHEGQLLHEVQLLHN